ncbi:hypothetical protein [Nocardiopsis ganjiahuensis]|uniref:hypothetical protein n=1 Tax=Nocardiopsis ganjiahuensis TaxID=239984 RepID=UPI0003449445|nr:hypothetical protein [Nocardiopsis ganjiahuensis]
MDAILEEEWAAFLAREGFAPEDGAEVAALVVEEPDRYDWRVVDAAMDRLVCPECGGPLSRGPAGCGPCDLANGFRYAAIEVDRPGVPPGNEHAVRVNVSVVRRPDGISVREVLARRLMLPLLLQGQLATTGQAQADKAKMNRMGIAEIEALFPRLLASPTDWVP